MRKKIAFQHCDVSLACFKAQCRGIKFYNLAEVGVEVGGRVPFRRNLYHFKDKNCVEVHLAVRSHEDTLSIVAETPLGKHYMPCTMSVVISTEHSEKQLVNRSNSKLQLMANIARAERSHVAVRGVRDFNDVTL